MFPAVRDWSEAMLTALAGGLAMFFAAIPKVIAFAVILIVGWFVAGLIARLAARLLRAVHFNDLAELTFTGIAQGRGLFGGASVWSTPSSSDKAAELLRTQIQPAAWSLPRCLSTRGRLRYSRWITFPPSTASTWAMPDPTAYCC